MKYSEIDNEINKIAQNFGIGGSIREAINLGGNWIELTNADFRSMMNDLRQTDNTIRDIVTGNNTGNLPLKDILKNIKSNLNIREYARIQTFDDDYDFVGSVSSQYKQIGNAVPVELARQMGECILKVLEN
jgi:site-specific DNA-cytosine methylase